MVVFNVNAKLPTSDCMARTTEGINTFDLTSCAAGIHPADGPQHLDALHT